MIKAQRTPLDVMDDIYSLAHWLTGSETKATELVNSTYLNVDKESSETELFTTFRTCYLDSINQDDAYSLPETPRYFQNNRKATHHSKSMVIRGA